MAGAAVHVKKDRVGAIEGTRRLRPAIREHARVHETALIETPLQEQTTSVVFVHARRMAGRARDKHNSFRCMDLKSAREQSEADQSHDHVFVFFGSRFCFRSSSVTPHFTPSVGTSAFAIHSSALRTTLRKFSLPQFTWR